MINYDNVTKKPIKDHNPNWPRISDHQYKILIILKALDFEQNYYSI